MLTLSKKRKFHLIFAEGSESSRERKFPGTRVPGNESSTYGSWERKYVETKVPVTILPYMLQAHSDFFCRVAHYKERSRRTAADRLCASNTVSIILRSHILTTVLPICSHFTVHTQKYNTRS